MVFLAKYGALSMNLTNDQFLNFIIFQFGRFTCKCLPGYGDRFSDDEDKSGRYCESCSADHCNGRGTCKIDQAKEKVCE